MPLFLVVLTYLSLLQLPPKVKFLTLSARQERSWQQCHHRHSLRTPSVRVLKTSRGHQRALRKVQQLRLVELVPSMCATSAWFGAQRIEHDNCGKQSHNQANSKEHLQVDMDVREEAPIQEQGPDKARHSVNMFRQRN